MSRPGLAALTTTSVLSRSGTTSTTRLWSAHSFSVTAMAVATSPSFLETLRCGRCVLSYATVVERCLVSKHHCLQVRHETDPTSDRGSKSREEEGYPWTAESELQSMRKRTAEGDTDVIEGRSFMVCYKQYHKRQPAHILADPARCTGFTQHPTVTGGRPINLLTGLGPS
eukprot:COSAG02_NODE_916_length_15971_cov_12.781061_6_plen_170_part_00